MSIACTYRGVGYGFKLPPGYRECEYLESTGTQWLDFEWYANGGMLCKLKGIWPPVSNSGLVTSRDAYNNHSPGYNRNFLDSKGDNSTMELGIGATYRTFTVPNGYKNGESVLEAEFNTRPGLAYVKVADQILISWDNSTVLNPRSTVKAFYNGYDLRPERSGRLYYCTIIDVNDVVVRDLIPCLDYNGVPGMFDKITGKTFYNQGTGTFNYKLKPQDIYYQLPEGYLECEYLESDGEKYIDTGITPGAGYGFSITYYIESPTGTGPSCKLLGSSVYNEGLWGGVMIQSWENGSYTFFSNFNTKLLTFGSKATISIVDGICNWDGEEFACNKASDNYSNINGSVWIMLVNSDATNFSRNNGRYYNFKTYQYTDVIQNLIPALDPSGVPCMYDIVGNKPYYNQGTGTFNYKLK